MYRGDGTVLKNDLVLSCPANGASQNTIKMRIYDQKHSYDDEPSYKPTEWRYGFACGNCDANIKFLQIRCEQCNGLIDWSNEIFD